MDLEPGRLLREARLRHGLSQERLAIRAGTTQSAISRIEQERGSPTVKTLAELLHLMGEDLVLIDRAPGGRDRSHARRRAVADGRGRALDYGAAFADQVIEMSPLPKRKGWER